MKQLSGLLLVVALLLSGCGYHLRGHGQNQVNFAFQSLYVQTPAETPFVTELRRWLTQYKLAVSPVPGKSDLTLEIVSEFNDKQIVALNASGHVIEYLLTYRVSLRAYDTQQQEWLPASEILLQRFFPYDDAQVLAKAQEEEMLMRDMRSDAVQQVIRRLNMAKPPKPAPAADQ